MRIPYLPAVAQAPLPSLGGALIRYRPILAVGIGGHAPSRLIDGLIDTGADDTVFEAWVATAIGLDLAGADERELAVVGRQQPIRCAYAPVSLRITDGRRETYEWTATVGFVSTRLRYALLGFGGFLQFFDCEFRGADREVMLMPNRAFSGKRT